MAMKKQALVSLALMLSSATFAQITFDDFSSGAYQKTLQTGTDVNVQSGTMAGGFRGTLLSVQSNPLNTNFNFRVGTGFADIGSGVNLISNTGLYYGVKDDGQGGFAGNDLNLNLSGLDALRIKFLFNDRNLNVRITIRSANGAQTGSVSRVIAGNRDNPFNEDFLFSDFSGSIDLSDVDWMQWQFDTSPSGDFTLDELGAVPEPATMLALATGAAVLVRRRRRK